MWNVWVCAKVWGLCGWVRVRLWNGGAVRRALNGALPALPVGSGETLQFLSECVA